MGTVRYFGAYTWYPRMTHPHISPFVKPICLPSLRCETMKQPLICLRDLSSKVISHVSQTACYTCSAVVLHVCLALLFVWQQSSTECFDRASLARHNPTRRVETTQCLRRSAARNNRKQSLSLSLSPTRFGARGHGARTESDLAKGQSLSSLQPSCAWW